MLSAVAQSATQVLITFDRLVQSSSVTVDGSQFTFSNGLTATSASVGTNARTVVVGTSAQTGGQSYTVTVAGSLTDSRGTALGLPNTASFNGFSVPARLVVNEVNVNLAGGKDLVELLAVQGGNIGTFVLESSAATLATLPALNVATGDIVVVHLSPGASDAGLDSETETTSKNQFSTTGGYTANYDSAWDVRGAAAGLGFSGQIVRIRDTATSTVVHGASFANGVSAPPASFLPALQQLQDAGLWLPGDCGGAVCTLTSTPTALAISADWSGISTSATGQSAQRIVGASSNSAADWAKDGGQSWGLPNQ